MKKIIVFNAVVFMFLIIVLSCSSTKNREELVLVPNVDVLGVWWWAGSTNIDGPYFDFLVKNGVNEIYFSSSAFDRETSDFIAKAHENGIKVYWLQGDWKWIHDDTTFRERYEQYLAYQARSDENRRFAGIHIDVEPHQDPAWREDRAANRMPILLKFMDFVVNLRRDFPNEHFDYDIPFWLSDEVEYKGQIVPLHQVIIQESDRVFIMSYRDSAEGMYKLRTVADQIEFARSVDKPIFLGVNASNRPEGSTPISFRDQGKRIMHEETNKLKYLANYDKLGIAIHHVRTWYYLKD